MINKTFKKFFFWSRHQKSARPLYITLMSLLVFNMSFQGMFFNIPEAEAEVNNQLCSNAVDVVMIIDRSGTMLDGSEPALCVFYTKLGNTWVKRSETGWNEIQCAAKAEVGAPQAPVWTAATNNKIADAKIAANTFLELLKNNDQSSLVSFATLATLDKGLSNNHAVTQAAVNSLNADGSTNIGAAIALANGELASSRANPQAVKVSILLTDGRANKPNGIGSGENQADVDFAKSKADLAAAAGYKIFTIGLGDDINDVMLQYIAATTGGSYYFAPTASDLNEIYNQISQRICEYGSISGYKYADINNDGNLEGEDVISGWEINLSGDFTASQITDADGHFSFSGLLPGSYSLSEGGKVGVTAYRQTYPLLSNPYTITLDEGENLVNKNFGNYLPLCGNDILDTEFGEVCELGDTQSCLVGEYSGNQSCSNDCLAWNDCVPSSSCGNDVIDADEDCDGSAPEHYLCTNTCTLLYQPYCGDSLLNQNTEACDNSLPIACETSSGYTGTKNCSSDCQWGTCLATDNCGDGTVNGSEICDDGLNNGNYSYCNLDCSGPTPSVCGNNIKEGAEECDAGISGSESCTDACTLIAPPITYSWSSADWSTCSASCGGGTQTRAVVCVSSQMETVADSFCTLEKPSVSQGCNEQSCGGGGGGGGGGSGSNVFSLANSQITMQCNGDKVDVTMTWLSSQASDSRVLYDVVSHLNNNQASAPNYGYAFSTPLLSASVTGHSVVISGLESNKAYYFRPVSRANTEYLGEEKAVAATLFCQASPEGVIVLGEEGAPKLTITNQVLVPYANPGDKGIDYKIIVTNEGNLTAFSTILMNTLPEGLTYSDDGKTERSWDLGDLGPGKSKTYYFMADVSPSAAITDYPSIAKASAANHDEVTATAVLPLRAASVLAATGFRPSELWLLLSVLGILIMYTIYLNKRTA